VTASEIDGKQESPSVPERWVAEHRNGMSRGRREFFKMRLREEAAQQREDFWLARRAAALARVNAIHAAGEDLVALARKERLTDWFSPLEWKLVKACAGRGDPITEDTVGITDEWSFEEDKALDETRAARYLGVTPGWLRRARNESLGPAFFRVGRSIRYTRSVLDDYLNRSGKEALRRKPVKRTTSTHDAPSFPLDDLGYIY